MINLYLNPLSRPGAGTFRRRLMYATALAAAGCMATAANAQEVRGAEQIGAVHPGEQVSADGLRAALHLGSIAPLAYTPPVAGQPRLPPADYVEPGVIGDPASWVTPEFQLDYGLAQIRAQHAYARGLTGRGIRAGVFDDGIEFGHTEFAGKNNQSITAADILDDGTLCGPVAGVTDLTGCFYTTGDRSNVEFYVADGNDRFTGLLAGAVGLAADRYMYRTGHGTHVAGTIAANRDENGAHGVAFGADLVSARLFADSISDLDSLVYEAFGLTCPAGACYSTGPQISLEAREGVYRDFVASGVRVINNSWGFTVRTPTVAQLDAVYNANRAFLDPIFDVTGAQTSAAGILQVFSAGNTPNDVAGLMSSIPRWKPEYEPYWVAVANITSTEAINAGSSICGAAAQWCVAAAGTTIWSAQFGSNAIGGSTPGYEIVYNDVGEPIGFREVAGGRTTNAFKTLTGTSMAAPHVTGALTLLFERYPYLDGTFVRDILLTTARDVGAPGVDNVFGWGIVDLEKAIEGPGQLIKDSTVNMTSRAGGFKTWEGDAWDAWTNDISGVGRLTKAGPGWLRLTGDNTFNGLTVQGGVLELTGANALASAVDVTGGVLMLGGSLTNTPLNITGGSASITGTVTGGLTTVGAGGALFGTGTIADAIVNGSITPGLAVADLGRLNVAGAYTQNAGSTFNVATRPVGASGLLAVTGAATLNGGTVNVLALPGLYQLGQTYTVLTAGGGVAGQFSGLTTTGLDLAFLKFSLVHRAGAVDLAVTRGASFNSVADTPNERAVAGSVDGLPNASPLLNRLSQLTPAQGQATLGQISGEAYPALQAGLIDGGRSAREAALSRVTSGANRPERGASLWADARRANGERGASDGYARVRQDTDTYLIGADFGLSDAFTLGVFGGWGQTEVKSPTLVNAEADNAHYGAYGVFRAGGWRLGGGAVFSQQNAEVRRVITTPGFAQSLRSESDYSGQQYFLDAGFVQTAGGVTAEPFIQLVQLRTSHDGLTETGGDLALTGTVEDTELTISTAGVRFSTDGANTPSNLRIRGTLGYRNVSGDLTPTARLGFATGAPFIAGAAPLSENAVVIEGAVAANVARNISIEAGYSGEFGSRYDNQIANIRLVMNF